MCLYNILDTDVCYYLVIIIIFLNNKINVLLHYKFLFQNAEYFVMHIFNCTRTFLNFLTQKIKILNGCQQCLHSVKRWEQNLWTSVYFSLSAKPKAQINYITKLIIFIWTQIIINHIIKLKLKDNTS